MRRLGWSLRGWSTTQDRAFHDALFTDRTYDPFSDAYPGRLAIRRFADLAGRHVCEGDHIVDLGCGPGEITCELARRFPTCTFSGVDHSREGIARAGELAAGLGLTNIAFEVGDLERYQPAQRIGLMTMFDAFHHLLDPAGFVRRIGESCDRFFLIEPAGDAFGRWRRSLDLDWLPEALFVIRDRLEYQFGLEPARRGDQTAAIAAGEPTEHRYSIEDFTRWFEGFGIDVHGTIAGLEKYGVQPHATSGLREDIGGAVYALVVEIEAVLRRHEIDLAAKHWGVYAERGRTFPVRRVPVLPERAVERPLTGAHDVEYQAFEGFTDATAGALAHATVRLVNRGWRVWDSSADVEPVFLSYHWLNEKGTMVVQDGLRSRLPRPIAPSESCTAALRIQCPDEPGRFTLAIDLIQEHVTWFSEAGAPPLRVPVRVVR